MKGVGRNPKGDGKKKGGLKVHMLTDVHADTAVFAKISEAKMHDKKFLQHLNPSKGSMLVIDKAYNYKYRWTIETTFKKLKQNFQLHFFYSDTENGIKTQIWCTLIAHLLLNVIRVISKSEKAFSTVAALIRIHLISHLDLTWMVAEGRRTYAKRRTSRNKSPATVQMALF